MDKIIKKYNSYSVDELMDMLENGDIPESEEYIVFTMACKKTSIPMDTDKMNTTANEAIDEEYLKSMKNRFAPFKK